MKQLISFLLVMIAFAMHQAGCRGNVFAGRGKSVKEATPTPSPKVEEQIEAAQVPKFGLLVNDLECGLCHVKVNGDIASTADVKGLWENTQSIVNGTWFAAKSYDVSQPRAGQIAVGRNVDVKVTGGVKQQYRGEELPGDLDGDSNPDFPVIDFAKAEAAMDGDVTAGSLTIKKVHNGNAVLTGDAANPIKITGEVLVKGDLVIKGVYTGNGTIYATGNIYIPADLKAANSAFPYSEDRTVALQEAQAAIDAKKDALGLATGMSIIVSDYETHGNGNRSVFDHPATPAGRTFADLNVKNIETWFDGGKVGYAKLYEDNPIECPGAPDNNRSISLIEAYLYAQNTIGGRANRNSYAINGGVIADHFHIISAAAACPAGTHPVHKLDTKWSYVNYDWRLQLNFPLLKQLYPYFTKK